ncbi:mannose-1-phosphate guanylyltransferase [Halopelagius longus]|uniref:Mannose-1-phosphate guanylyltransferase n=1 Tax=Halopelagius longus TaxID=1236180 RepID=A0A1H1E4G4_9EURY|nr:sugar phosphate nucleotidyltransferase [Halopelagius longus]RDI71603.1 mannose-1-phosphate guanylyltransferase [Halopelagius longus]SDQ83614.1 mannose-1-phosphate guanylyltransferase [Halopelagius longus]
MGADDSPETDSNPDRPVVALVLAGGTGSRLYPASRSDRPKQFLSLFGEESLLARTIARAREVADEVVVSTCEGYADEVRERAPDAEVIVEPAGKDTGPALAYATYRIRERLGECVVAVLPSDHRVGEGFAEAIRRGARVAARTGRLVTFGVEPTRPDTGYGYLEPGEFRDGFAPVVAFHEKPDAETAREYVAAGHLWNAGIFAWTPEALLAAARDSPLSPMIDALDEGASAAEAFDRVPAVSIDYAVMERTADAVVVPVEFRWDDLGAWDALERVLPADDDGTVAAGDVEVRSLDAEDNVVAADGKHVSLVGVSDLAVVAWGDRVLVVPKDRAQAVRALVDDLKDRDEF